MNNFVVGLKKFFTNKNVVTILGVLGVLVILFFGYTSSIKKQTNPVVVPVAAKKINPETQITDGDVEYKKIPGGIVTEGVMRNSVGLIGKYTNINVTIPKGSLFYSEWIVDQEQIPGNWIEGLDYKKGELGYYMSVNITNTLGNSVKPNSYIDIYMKAEDENGSPIFGKLLKNIKVLVVHDGQGKNIFNDNTAIGSPSKIGFGVSPDLYILLKKAEYLDLDLIIAPRGSTVPENDNIIVTSSTLRDYIDTKAETIPEDVIIEETEENPEENPEIIE